MDDSTCSTATPCGAAIAEVGPAVVYHLAGAPHVGQSWEAATETLAVNVLGTHHLLDALRLEGLPRRVVVPSSALRLPAGGLAP